MSEIDNKKTIDDTKKAFKESMAKSNDMFNQIDTEEIQKDNEQALAEIGQQIENYPKPSEVDQNSVKEYMANLYMTLKAIYSVTKNMNRALLQINANDKDLLNEKREKDFMNDNSNNSNLDPVTRITKLEESVSNLDSFFNNASPQSLAQLIEQLENFNNDNDMQMLAGMKSMFGNRSPQEIKELIDKLGNGSDSLRVVKQDDDKDNKDDNSKQKNHENEDNKTDSSKDKDNKNSKSDSSKDTGKDDKKDDSGQVNNRAAILGAEEDDTHTEDDTEDNDDKDKKEENNDELKGRSKKVDDDDVGDDDLPF